MKNTGLTAIILLIIIGCSSSKRIQEIQSVMLYRGFPVIDTIINNKWTVSKIDPDYTKLYFLSDLIIVQQSVPSTPVKMLNGQVVWRGPTTLKYNSIIFSNDAVIAIYCDSTNTKTARFVNKDSILRKQWAFENFLDSVFLKSKYKQLSIKKDSIGNIVQEYSVDSITDTTLKGKCILEFSKKEFLNIPYDFSKLWRRKGQKLIRFTVKSNPRSLGEEQIPIDSISMTYKLMGLQIENQEEIRKLFDYAAEKLKQPVPKP